MRRLTIQAHSRHTPAPALGYFLAFVMALFVGILIFIWVASKRANPILLDESGKPVASSPQHHHAGH
ncbi:MAG: hypothetical protein ACE14L_07080 [Terriglobales bacterium]